MHGLFRWSSKWWPGVIPLVVFWAIAAWTGTAPLETDLSARSTAALKDTVLDKTRIAVAGRDVTFAADAFSEDGRRSALAAVEPIAQIALGRIAISWRNRNWPQISISSGRGVRFSGGLHLTTLQM